MRKRTLKSLTMLSLLLAGIGQSPIALAQVSGPPSTNCHVTDGSFTTCPDGITEWADVQPIPFPSSDRFLYVNQDSTHSFLYLMYDMPLRRTPLAANDSVQISFDKWSRGQQGRALCFMTSQFSVMVKSKSFSTDKPPQGRSSVALGSAARPIPQPLT